ncbi:hypothetical protein [Leptolyngbya sp. FACHB-671]|uniref:hypothetical protein n=1 Tax=Leptolyngbya sp. FACHB-671 TaxID=2692812 RepID=UPI00168A0035|nr:hypothetical protein [Leptolyngbya sp. FACHB-671]
MDRDDGRNLSSSKAQRTTARSTSTLDRGIEQQRHTRLDISSGKILVVCGV